MKYTIICLLISFNLSAQNYADSAISIVGTQRLAYWIGQHVKQSFAWSNRNAPTILQPYIGSGTRPDSVYNVTLNKASFLYEALDLIISQPLQISYADYRSIMLNTPSIPTYQGIIAQIIAKANNANDPQQQTAIWLRDKYQTRTAKLDAVYQDQKQSVIEWSRN